MKATKLLEEQHRKVEAAFEKIESAAGDPSALLKELANDLAAHMSIEQQLFYPAVREVNAELVDESYEEHSMAELALKRLLRTSPADPAFRARVTVLKELIEHHVDEEESDLFPAVDDALGDAKLEQLGTRMEKVFKEARAQGFEALVPSGFAKTSADDFERLVENDRPNRRASAQRAR
jgi:hemerythrin-like domain-containing protein